jgi:hypothetical protein
MGMILENTEAQTRERFNRVMRNAEKQVKYPVVYGPGSGSVRDRAAAPLGWAATERGALRIARRKLITAPFETLQAKLVTHPDLGEGAEVTVWSVSHRLERR